MFNRDSKVINSIRFPLACMVVILHSYVAVQGFHISQLEWINLTGVETYSLVGITFSLVLTQVAVPLFFFISGYLFYRGLTNWSWEIYFDKLKRRIRTLIIPYFVWNTIQAIIIIGILFFAYILFNKPVGRISDWFQNVGGFWGIYWANDATATIKENIFGWISYKTYPLLVPMWFIRDLMLVVVLSPILWYFLKKTLSLFLVLTAFFWIIGTGTNIPGLSFNSILFFSMGGAFSVKSISFIGMFEKVNKYVLLILCVLLGGASVILGGRTTTLGQIVLSLWIFPALISAMKIVVFFVDRYPVLSEKVSQLSESTYFVFAFHGVILSYILSALWKLFRVKTDVGLIDSTYIADHPLNGIVCYLLTPCLAIAISIICYWIIKIIFKKRSWPLTGK